MNPLEQARNMINEIDKQMADLFERRMKAAELVSAYKNDHGLEIYDPKREEQVIRQNTSLIQDKVIKKYYVDFLKNTMAISRTYQGELVHEKKGPYSQMSNVQKGLPSVKSINMNLGNRSYDIHVGNKLLEKADEFFNLNRKVFILTDTGVPKEYSKKIGALAKEALIYTVPEGESSKSISTFKDVLTTMLDFDMSRKDVLVAVGGGVVGDLGGYAAASYMRGIDYYQVPTTVLAQVDSSIGGKCAINLDHIKNVLGAFYQPKGVLIDVDTLSTLDDRLISAGLAESIKMSLICDKELFSIYESQEINANNIQDIILHSLAIKKSVVEADEKESGLRKILNFGHTLGHGIEAQVKMKVLYHGECVALGMLPMCSEEVKDRLILVLKKLNIPTTYPYDLDKALDFVVHDKKTNGNSIDIITVPRVGSYKIQNLTINDYKNMVKERMMRP